LGYPAGPNYFGRGEGFGVVEERLGDGDEWRGGGRSGRPAVRGFGGIGRPAPNWAVESGEWSAESRSVGGGVGSPAPNGISRDGKPTLVGRVAVLFGDADAEVDQPGCLGGLLRPDVAAV
jgi:hypothetical protein